MLGKASGWWIWSALRHMSVPSIRSLACRSSLESRIFDYRAILWTSRPSLVLDRACSSEGTWPRELLCQSGLIHPRLWLWYPSLAIGQVLTSPSLAQSSACSTWPPTLQSRWCDRSWAQGLCRLVLESYFLWCHWDARQESRRGRWQSRRSFTHQVYLWPWLYMRHTARFHQRPFSSAPMCANQRRRSDLLRLDLLCAAQWPLVARNRRRLFCWWPWRSRSCSGQKLHRSWACHHHCPTPSPHPQIPTGTDTPTDRSRLASGWNRNLRRQPGSCPRRL